MKNTIALLFMLIFVSVALAQPDDMELEKGLYATISTSKGDIFLKLYPEITPLTVANFVGLAEGDLTVFDSIEINEPFYDGLVFHRVIADFMIQGGDPDGNGSGGPGYKFWNETDNDLEHIKGALSMANSGINTNGSQFFITHKATPHLNGKHTVFGKVLSGQDVVDKIDQGDTIQRIEIVKKGLKYKWFYNPTKVFKKEYERLGAKAKKEKLKAKKIVAQNKVRLAEAKAKSKEEYKTYFYDLIKKMEPDAKQTESGLVYIVREEGEGEVAKKGDKVSLHYMGRLVYGDKFDSSYDRGKPLNFSYLEMNLIPGFDEGVGLTKKYTKIDLYIPYFLAYGKAGRKPTIPPYSDLIFEINILEIEK